MKKVVTQLKKSKIKPHQRLVSELTDIIDDVHPWT